jgi:hypothetical protein
LAEKKFSARARLSRKCHLLGQWKLLRPLPKVVANFIGYVDEHLRIKEWIRLACSGNHLQLKWTLFLPYSPLTMALLDIMGKTQMFNSDEKFSPVRIKVVSTDST